MNEQSLTKHYEQTVIVLLNTCHKMTIIGILLLFFFILTFHRITKSSPLKKYFFPALLFKMICGLLVGWVYTYYYQGGDTFALFKDGIVLHQVLKESIPQYLDFLLHSTEDYPESILLQLSNRNERAVFMAKWISLVNILTNNNYWVTACYFSLFSFWGCWVLSTQLYKQFPTLRSGIVVSFLFYPSVTFWSSGIMKESILLGAIGLCTAIVILLLREFKGIKSFSLLLGVGGLLWVIFRLKYYYFAIYFPCLLILVTSYLFIIRWKYPPLRVFIMSCVLLLTVIGAMTVSHPNLQIERVLEVIYLNYEKLSGTVHQSILIPDLRPTLRSFISHVPQAITEGLFRPYLWEKNTLLQTLQSIENSLLLLLSMTSIYFFRSWKVQKKALPFLWAVLPYIALLIPLLAFASPNLGTLSRYKVGYLSFLLLLIISGIPAFHKNNSHPLNNK
ncbi:hypothetical protein [Algivirga pacifica]|uniref:hypothetical protein n=1 Tax=Algivirga pacifica TaxID=1162670 RepID=UPI0031E7BC2B